MVPLGGVVVHDVEDDLDAGTMQVLHHLLELVDLLPALSRRRVLRVRRQVPDRVVAPVVAQAALDEVRVVNELVHRHELDGGHAQPPEVIDRRRMRERGVGAAQIRRNLRMPRREPLHVRLVHHRVMPAGLRRPVAAPVEIGVDDHALRHRRRAVGGVGRPVRISDVVREERRVPVDVPLDRLPVRIEEELGRVAAVSAFGRPRSVHAEAVPLARPDSREIAVPAERRHLRKLQNCLAAGIIEEAQVHPLGDLRKQREVRARAVVGRAQRKRLTGPHFELRDAARPRPLLVNGRAGNHVICSGKSRAR